MRARKHTILGFATLARALIRARWYVRCTAHAITRELAIVIVKNSWRQAAFQLVSGFEAASVAGGAVRTDEKSATDLKCTTLRVFTGCELAGWFQCTYAVARLLTWQESRYRPCGMSSELGRGLH